MKSENVATTLGVLMPGAGHYYTGESGRATMALLGFAAGVTLAVTAPTDLETTCTFNGWYDECGDGYSDAATTQMLAGGILALGAWGFSVIDARRSARRVNRRSGASVTVRPLAPTPGSSHRIHLAVTIRTR